MNKSLDEYASKESGKSKMLKHQLPGNNTLTDAEQSKLGARQDRYGVFSSGSAYGNDATSDFDQVVAN